MDFQEIRRDAAEITTRSITAEGGSVINCLGWLRGDVVCLDENGDTDATLISITAAKMFHNFWKYGDNSALMREAHGLRLAGANRRTGLLRRFVEISPDDAAQIGDKLILEDTQGNRHATPPIIEIVRPLDKRPN